MTAAFSLTGAWALDWGRGGETGRMEETIGGNFNLQSMLHRVS